MKYSLLIIFLLSMFSCKLDFNSKEFIKREIINEDIISGDAYNSYLDKNFFFYEIERYITVDSSKVFFKSLKFSTHYDVENSFYRNQITNTEAFNSDFIKMFQKIGFIIEPNSLAGGTQILKGYIPLSNGNFRKIIIKCQMLENLYSDIIITEVDENDNFVNFDLQIKTYLFTKTMAYINDKEFKIYKGDKELFGIKF